MPYKNLRNIFHDQGEDYEAAYNDRLTSDQANKIEIDIKGYPAFFVMVPEIYQAIINAERLDKQICNLIPLLPGKAIESYMQSCLIDEIVITNEIEGVNSTRREIGEVLDRLKENDKRGRFHGLVRKYLTLIRQQDIPLATCEEIRSVYNDLVLDEVIKSNPSNTPDGQYFRTGPVSVCDAAGIPIHQGIESESSIVKAMEKSLLILKDDNLEPLVRISLFHFLFGYIHPFYDGNGRTNRFISSYMISEEYSPLVGLRISYAVKDSIKKYYKGFGVCEHPLNRGDLTPFIISFSEIIVSAMESMRDSLREKRELLAKYEQMTEKLFGSDDCVESYELANVLVVATLFSANGITTYELAETFGVSRQTVYKRLASLKDKDLVSAEKVGRATYYRMDTEKLTSLAEGC